MLVRFETQSYATITMFGDVALTLIKLMGHSGRIPGALLAEDIPAALARLESAVAAHPEAMLDPDQQGQQAREESQRVSLAHRALPLIALLKAAQADGANVIWDH